jgi:glutamine synthetase
VSEPGAAERDLLEQLERRGIELVALAFVDNAGVARAKAVPAHALARAAVAGVGSPRVLGVFTGNDGIADAGELSLPVGDLRLVPDLGALAGGVDGWGWAPADQIDQEGRAWRLCPRSLLRRTAELARARGYELRMAFELEWYAERVDGTPVHAGPAYGLPALGDAGPHLAAVARGLAAHGIAAQQVHAEYSPGQLEVSLAAAEPLEAADHCVLARHVIRSCASASELRASFSPLTYAGMVGNGCHLHVSLWQGGTNLFGVGGAEPERMPEAARAFLAGALRALPGLVALGCSSPLSYKRLGPTRWTGAFQCWGVENREAPLRFIAGSAALRPGAANVELKPLDSSGNPYLVAAGLIAAGLDGIEQGTPLPPPVSVDPATLADADRDRLGLDPLPADAESAAAALERSDVLRTAFGEELHGAIVAVRRAEAAAAASLSDEELSAYYRWRY